MTRREAMYGLILQLGAIAAGIAAARWIYDAIT